MAEVQATAHTTKETFYSHYPTTARMSARVYAGFLLVAMLAADDLPKFKDYPAGRIYQSPAAAVRLTTPTMREFRTRLREGGKQPADFAGHYKFAIWGCGSNCASGAIIDLVMGQVFEPPPHLPVVGDFGGHDGRFRDRLSRRQQAGDDSQWHGHDHDRLLCVGRQQVRPPPHACEAGTQVRVAIRNGICHT
jgi:hypothetical protein